MTFGGRYRFVGVQSLNTFIYTENAFELLLLRKKKDVSLMSSSEDLAKISKLFECKNSIFSLLSSVLFIFFKVSYSWPGGQE